MIMIVYLPRLLSKLADTEFPDVIIVPEYFTIIVLAGVKFCEFRTCLRNAAGFLQPCFVGGWPYLAELNEAINHITLTDGLRNALIC